MRERARARAREKRVEEGIFCSRSRGATGPENVPKLRSFAVSVSSEHARRVASRGDACSRVRCPVVTRVHVRARVHAYGMRLAARRQPLRVYI